MLVLSSVAVVVPGQATGRVTGAAVAAQDETAVATDETTYALEGDPALAVEIEAEAVAGVDPLVAADAQDPAAPQGPGTRIFSTPDAVLTATGPGAGFATVGVTWDAGSAPEGTNVAVRTRDGETWSEWVPLELEGLSEPGTGEPTGAPVLRDGTEPLLVGVVDEIQAVVRGTGEELPENPELVVIDPGADSAASSRAPSASASARTVGDLGAGDVELVANHLTTDAAARTDSGALSSQDGLVLRSTASSTTSALETSALPTALSAPVPTISSRAQWGADESIMRWTPQIGVVKGAVIHHTAGTNNYTAANVPSILRGIYTYHAQSRGWGDIGYNFLVDKFGGIWEGRSGGIDRAVIGAHASGFNSELFGVSVMGNYQEVAVPQAAVSSVSRVVAWKLALHGVHPEGTAVVNGVRRPTVVGHRDVGQTSCPGAYLYPLLGSIRASATALQGATLDRGPSRDLTGDALPDLVLRGSSAVSLGTASSAGWRPAALVGSGWTGTRTIAPGDWDGDKVPDLMLLGTDGRLWLYPGTAAGGWGTQRAIGTGWQTMNLIIGGHDWNGDGRDDLLARRASDGTLWLYPSAGKGGFGAARQIGNGWNVMSSISMVGNLRDGRPALAARGADGVLRTYVGDGKGGFSGDVLTLGTGWNAMTAIIGAGDMTGDGNVDLVARDTAGDLWVYVGDGAGSYLGRSRIGSGWQGFTAVLPAGRAGPGQDFYAITSGGALYRYVYQGTGKIDRTVSTGISSTGVAEVIAPGDWNGDGRPDLLTRRTNGALHLHAGLPGGGFDKAGRQVGTGWSVMSQVVAAGDWLGTGVPGLIALNRSTGLVWLYPGDGRGGFGVPFQIGSGASSVDMIVSVGQWAGGMAPDLVTRERGTGRLHLRRGNGGASLGAPTLIGSGWASFSAIVGAGDVDGDGLPDILAVSPDRKVYLYPGDGASGFGVARSIGNVPADGAVS
ncbi:hypothetical protein DLJ96_07460 [Actinotalea fermentans ATCC 43279 = JCM 9966 = DSM 3133]|nr:hypothetical protein DLJ96_07460 [Actinotalea fermentans ATCC 43279 = JCM 9966 = DSM 3133]